MRRLAAFVPLLLLATPAAATNPPAPSSFIGARLSLALPDRQGHIISLQDPRYRGKVVVLTIGGAWCVNCHDEARFLVPWAARRKAEGVEIIGLHFEYPPDPQKAGALIDRFAQRHAIPWPLLLAGQPSRAGVAAALNGLGGITSLPSTLLIGRDGRVRHLHAGWADKQSGEVTASAAATLNAQVDRLLTEPAP
jgi:peroxiredoxin